MQAALAPVSLIVSFVAIGIVSTISRSTSGDSDGRLAILQSQVNEQAKTIEALRGLTRLALDAAYSKTRSADFDPSSRDYCRVDTEGGYFLISVDDVSPYADGTKVRFRVGNPLGCRFVGFKLTVLWGPRFTGNSADTDAYVRWRTALTESTYSFPKALEPGMWNPIEIVLPGANANQIGHLMVSMSTNTVSLGVGR